MTAPGPIQKSLVLSCFERLRWEELLTAKKTRSMYDAGTLKRSQGRMRMRTSEYRQVGGKKKDRSSRVLCCAAGRHAFHRLVASFSSLRLSHDGAAAGRPKMACPSYTLCRTHTSTAWRLGLS